MQVAQPRYADAVDYFRKQRRLRKFLPPKDVKIHPEALELLSDIGYGQLTPDFIIPSGRELRSLNREVDWPRYHIGTRWSIIALAGTGDAWLASNAPGDCEIAFGDHARGYSSRPRQLRINPKQWLCLAMALDALEVQLESLRKTSDGDRARRRLYALTRKRLEQLSVGLSRRYPFRLEEESPT